MSLKENSRYGKSTKYKRNRWNDLVYGNALNGIEDFGPILPEQLRTSGPETGERLLWMSVLASAIDDICRKKEELLINVERWVVSSDEDALAPVPYPHLCHVLRLDEEYGRSKLLGYIDHVRTNGTKPPKVKKVSDYSRI